MKYEILNLGKELEKQEFFNSFSRGNSITPDTGKCTDLYEGRWYFVRDFQYIQS